MVCVCVCHVTLELVDCGMMYMYVCLKLNGDGRCLSLYLVDDFREVAQLMLKTHRFTGQAPREGDNGGRVEFLPVHWHTALHGDDTGVDW